MFRPIAIATAICGTLDILFAMILTLAAGREIPNMLRIVASGPFPQASAMGTGGAILGLIVHYILMGLMATGIVLLVRWRPRLAETPLRTGLAYGILTYFIMNWLVVPLRFHTPLPPKAISLATQLFAHLVLVGIPMAYIAARYLRPRPR
ncbi:MAG TPA: hypothetical protein VHS33_00665 [Sphingomicrobium sp.]|jgi:hypothetical protein|nr:hypothetical protein [Sphingomicrobium sp.]